MHSAELINPDSCSKSDKFVVLERQLQMLLSSQKLNAMRLLRKMKVLLTVNSDFINFVTAVIIFAVAAPALPLSQTIRCLGVHYMQRLR